MGGELIHVENMVPAGTEPHDWELPQRILPALKERMCSSITARAWNTGLKMYLRRFRAKRS
jgi:hypothetical protein